MKTPNIYFCIFIILLSIAACTPTEDNKNNTPTYIDVSQISSTDVQGQAMGATDPTDWTYDATWTDEEHALLLFNDTLANNADAEVGSVQISPAYPNPTSQNILASFSNTKNFKLRIAIVDSALHVKYQQSYNIGGPITFFNVKGMTGGTGNYRMYYGFYNSKDSLYYKGHGDIKIE